MKRDWDLVREILLKLEGCESARGNLRPEDVSGRDQEIVSYHMQILMEAALIVGECSRTIGAPLYCTANRLTWAGHEFLDQVRSHTAWNRIKGLARERGLDITLDVIKAAAKMIVDAVLK
jgi:hypothetical protein